MADKVYPNALIVTDAPETSRAVLPVLAGHGVRATVVREAAAGRERLGRGGYDLLLLDGDTLGDDALAMVRAVKAHHPELPVLLLGSTDSADLALQSVRAGCDDYLVKPLDGARLAGAVEALLPNHEVEVAAAETEDARCLFQIAGRSRQLQRVLDLSRRVAPTSVPVLIAGESGTGKELVSYFIHSRSQRTRGPYIRVNCAALSESLLESELFGHERGAFTGAVAQRKGKFELAHGGTLLLDEISETGPKLQAELLRVLEQQDFERVGGSERVSVNVRILSTTNRDLQQEVAQGRFRRDLYYRISGVRVDVPPLRDRKDDIPVLVWHFVNLYAREVRRRVTRIDDRMLQRLLEYAWPGNVRQLRNTVRTALILGEGETLSLDDAPHLEAELAQTEDVELGGLHLQELEKKAILEALRRTKSHQAKAAQLLGITDRTLREKLRRYREEGEYVGAGERTW